MADAALGEERPKRHQAKEWTSGQHPVTFAFPFTQRWINPLKNRRISYVSGPIDAAQAYQNYLGSGDKDYFGTVYLNQLYAVAAEQGLDLQVITTLPETPPSYPGSPPHVCVNLPSPTGRGLAYHLQMIWWCLTAMAHIMRFRPAAVIMTAGQDYFFLFSMLRLFGIDIVTSYHCTVWPQFSQKPWHLKLLLKLNAWLYLPLNCAIIGVSEVVRNQVLAICPNVANRTFRFLPTYQAEQFAEFKPAVFPEGQVEILFVGRIEENKGVFDLVEMARFLERQQPGKFIFHVCGTGSAEDEFRRAVDRLHSEFSVTAPIVHFHGHSGKDALTHRYQQCHIVLVPTRSSFEEGLPKVCAEAVLAFRPLITSGACPLMYDVLDATVEVQPDAVQQYIDAILLLSRDRALFDAKVAATVQLRQMFLDQSRSYAATAWKALTMTRLGNQKA